MIAAWLLGGALCVATGVEGAKSPELDRAAYRAAAAAAGRDADAHVDLALWCEARGMTAGRTRHLARAVLLDPDNARARGLLGQVKRDGRWSRPADVVRTVEESPEQRALLDEYFKRRAQTADKADDQYKLALWCEERGLEEPMTAHLHRALQLDPGREGAWRRLGFKKVGKRWVNPEVEAAMKAEREAHDKAEREWTPKLEKLRNALTSKIASNQTRAREELAAIADPRAVPSIFKVFAKGGNEARQRVAVDALSRLDGPDASLALATLAVYSPHASIRSDAASLLPQRDPREFAGFLAASIRDEIKYRVKPIDGAGAQGELLVEGKDSKVRRLYRPTPELQIRPGDRLERDANGKTVLVRPTSAPMVGNAFHDREVAWLMKGGRTIAGYSMNPAMGFGQDPVTGLPMALSRDANPLWSPQEYATYQALSRTAFQLAYQSDRPKVAAATLERAGVPAGLAQTVTGRLQQGRQALADWTNIAFSALNNPNLMSGSRNYMQWTGGLTLRPIVQNSLMYSRTSPEASAAVQMARKRLEADVAGIEAHNAPIRETNERALAVLKSVSGEDLGKDRTKWMDWVVDLQGYGQPLRASSAPTEVVEDVPLYRPQTTPIPTTAVAGFRIGPSCFAGGTPVRTLRGDRPIESILPGDMVLSRDAATGALAYKPVVEALHNPPNWTYAVEFKGGDVVRPTGIHRFWKAGEGWAMARDLKPGDRLRTVDGLVEVASVEKSRDKAPVFNLLLGDADSYHVGSAGLLVHDNGFVDPVASPFDAVPAADELVAAAKP